MRLQKWLILITLTTSLLATQACSRPVSPEESCNFVQNSEQQRVSWGPHVPVKLYIHESVPTEAYAAIDRAVSEYNLKVANGREVFRIIARGTSGVADAQRDGYSTIYWLKTWDTTRRNEQARTTIYWTGSEIFEADMRINASFQYYLGENSDFNEVDLVSLVVHELGHVLGLGHTVSAGSVMNYSLDQGQDRRKLGDNDVASLKCEY